MSMLRNDKMRPLFKEAIVTKQSTTRYQMKAMDIIFPMIPHESLWVKWFGNHSPAKLGIFPKYLKVQKCTFFTTAKNLFLRTFFQKAVI